MADPLRHLDVCAGIGGFSLGLKLALGDSVRTVGYVEREAFCASILLARMGEQALDRARVWCAPIEELDGSELRGQVDIFTAGFPCQPFSCAGKRRGMADERAIWPAIRDLVAAVEPACVFLENVDAESFRAPWRDLRDMGFELPPPVCIEGEDVGAPVGRARWFALVVSDRWRQQAERIRCLRRQKPEGGYDANGCGEAVASTDGMPAQQQPRGRRQRRSAWLEQERPGATAPCGDGCEVGGADEPRREGGLVDGAWLRPWPPARAGGEWAEWPAELRAEWLDYIAAGGPQPGVRRGADRVPARVDGWADRIRAIGNSVCPQMVAAAWKGLT